MGEMSRSICFKGGCWGRSVSRFFCLVLVAALLLVISGHGLAVGDVDPVAVQIEQAIAKARGGELDEAIDDLGFMMLRNSRNNSLHYTLGTMLEEKGDMAGAMKEYRKAYVLLEKKSHGTN